MKMLAFARQGVCVVVGFMNELVRVVSSVLSVCHALGYILVKYFVLLVQTLADGIVAFFTVLRVLYEDFRYFFNDVSSKLADIGAFLTNIISVIGALLKNGVVAIRDYCWHVCSTIIDFFCFLFDTVANGLYFMVDAAEFLKWSVILIGRGIWMAIQLVPLCILYATYSIYNFITSICIDTYQSATIVSNAIANKTTIIAHWTVTYFFDFPVEAIFGLLLGAVLMYVLVKCHMRMYIATRNSIWRTVRFFRTTAACLWLVVVHRVQSWWHRGNANQPLAVDSDSDSVHGDEVPAPNVRRSMRIRARAAVSMNIKEPNLDALKRQLEREKEEKLCVACQDQNKCVIVLPCRHLCLCEECCLIIRHTTCICPICRQEFDRHFSVYM